ncbi:hypothetical protein VF06_37475 [Nostoc linckia z4]|uniref:Uncharacterized protein n=1 Tax=Nostoc linckia z8 TaxID=1628746 RepID=A0A9Q6EKS0_NOSLI|nr:hypothetical protein [Nostoc linckia]PHJ54510.1 hypothetical protein VF02_36635 [Nostoc linckia z1]PHJ69414.1 hypothetical protein VF03_24050 [Nostoc linckia z2]PHJ70863.1 hypothetical protein VF06_37475 [Nostoc linckia z4]PHJ79668.1 hypothetical protein VF07_33325 [Nostoc linckia z6]PHK02493.1 hypothetical protein VF08_18325 [Nostoc linckia z8]
MVLETFAIKSKLCITLDANTGSTVKPLLTYTPYNKAGYRLIHEYLEIENLKAVGWIYSLTEVEFPVFELEDTESKQLLTAINLEWNSPRIQMDVVLDVGNTLNWQRIAAYSLLNSSPYPYREYSLGNHSLGDNSMIGLQIRNVGFGLLQNGTKGQDKVTAFADLKRVVTLERIVDTSQKIANNITNIAAIIVNANTNRKGLTFFNSSDKNIFIDTVSTVSGSSYMVKLEPGDYYEAPAPIYTGNYYAVVASGSTAIDIREFV